MFGRCTGSNLISEGISVCRTGLQTPSGSLSLMRMGMDGDRLQEYMNEYLGCIQLKTARQFTLIYTDWG